jgi:hypothetical protein
MFDVMSAKSTVWLTRYTKKIMLGNTGLDVCLQVRSARYLSFIGTPNNK